MDWLIDSRDPKQRERCARVDKVLLNGEVVSFVVAAAPDRVLVRTPSSQGWRDTELHGDVTIIDKK